MRKNKVFDLAMGGMMAALVFVATWFIKLPVSLTQGYIHLGDGFILLGAALLGKIAIPAAAVGSMLADLLGGYTVYCLPTFLIKGAVAAVAVQAFRRSCSPIIRILWMILAELVMVAGYFAAEWLVLGYGLAAAASAVLPNLVQAFSGVVIGAVFAPILARRFNR